MVGKSLALQAEEQAAQQGEPNPENPLSAYVPGYAQRAHDLCLRGATDAEIAEVFEVHPASIADWKRTNPIFARALRNGREKALGRVARSLYAAATGQKIKETKAFVINGKIETIDIVKELPVSVPAATLVLTNRDGGRWKDKRVGEGSGLISADLLQAIEEVAIRRAAKVPGDDAKVIDGQLEDDL